MPSALKITIVETLALLDGEFVEFARGIADDGYAIWLGAGISLAKLPGLEGVAQAVLEHLRGRIDTSNPKCRFRASLDRIVGLVGPDADDWREIDYAKPVAAWRDQARICRNLTGVYARMLDQHPQGEAPDYLVWAGIDVVARYANPAITPGPEHLGLAALIAEGAASDTASANWDGLVEQAVGVLMGSSPAVLQVRLLPDDVKDNNARARLYKFHGCAHLAAANESIYRDRIVGRASQIHGWADKGENKVIAAKLQDLAISKATLMLGLSAQDTNIQNIFVVAQQNLPAAFPTHPPAVVLSENGVGADQLSLLQNFYKADYAGKTDAIHASALLQSYGRSLLPALWLHVLCAKLEAFLAKAVSHLALADREQLQMALRGLRDAAASLAPADQHEPFMLSALELAGRAVSLFRDGKPSASTGGIYNPLSISGVSRSLADPSLASSGLSQLATAAALIGRGVTEGLWTCGLSDPADPKSGAVRITGAVRSAEVFFAANAQAATRLVAAGHASEDDDAVIVHSHEVPSAAARHPTAAPGRTLRRGRREFSVAPLVTSANDAGLLLKSFKSEMAL